MTRTRLPILLAAGFLLTACGSSSNDQEAECPTPCFTAPDPQCDGDTLISFNPLSGQCVDGQCVYQANAPRDCGDDDQICSEGQCVDPPSPCEDVTCDSPPDDECDGEDGVRIYEETGTCEVVEGEASCVYASELDRCRRSERCELVEVDGEEVASCERRPCWNVDCLTPPPAECDGTVIVTYEESGSCDQETEACSYAEADRSDCADSGRYCRDGRCVDRDPCDDVSCDEIPEPFCDGAVLHTFAESGICSAGECDYGERTTDCSDDDLICDVDGCRERRPCEGVVCNDPPADFCDGQTAVSYAATGACIADDCSYSTTRLDCFTAANVCVAGVCVEPDACDGVVCNDPPSNFCRDDIAVRYANPGTCSGGICNYAESERDCADEDLDCFVGDCELDDPCQGVVCSARPDPECRGDLAVSFALPGECVGGDCVFVEFEEDCTRVEGGFCNEGECDVLDPCDGILCNDLPDATCVGATRVTYSGIGLCADGECDYDGAASAFDCTTDGLTCYEGACVEPGQALRAGDLLVTEIMADPLGGSSTLPWFEVYFPGGGGIGGLEVRAGSGTIFTVSSDTEVGEYVVFGASELAVPGGVDVVWPSGFSIDPSADSIQLTGATLVDRVSYDSTDGWPLSPGVSIVLSIFGLETGENDDSAEWCASPVEYDAGVFGSPGAPNGTCGGPVGRGDLVITEIMVDGRPRPGGREQWFEIYNAGGEEFDIGGTRFVTSGGSFAVGGGTLLGDGEYFVFGYDVTVAGGPDYLYGTELPFDPRGDTLSIWVGSTLIDEVDFTTDGDWPYDTGVSMQLDGVGADNSDALNWCASTAAYPGFDTNLGTPGDAADCAG